MPRSSARTRRTSPESERTDPVDAEGLSVYSFINHKGVFTKFHTASPMLPFPKSNAQMVLMEAEASDLSVREQDFFRESFNRTADLLLERACGSGSS